MSGLFITFEGIEGSGKTTQINLLADHFRQQGRHVVTTREPGGSPIGQELRELILSRQTQFSSHYSELLLFVTDRLEHVETKIKPALQKGDVVICDRYMDSTSAYQIGGRGLEPSVVTMLNEMVGLVPDQTFLLDLDPEIGLSRARSREDTNRFEDEAMSFHTRIREYYLKLSQEVADRISVISVGDKNPEQVHQNVILNLAKI